MAVNYRTTKTLVEFFSHSQKEDTKENVKKRCQSELKANLIPAHCFSWSLKEEFFKGKEDKIKEWLNERCSQALKNTDSVAYGLEYKNILSESCRKSLSKAALIWRYQQRQKMGGELLGGEDVGRKIELIFGHESMESESTNTVSPTGTTR